MTVPVSEYVTVAELELRLKGINDKLSRYEEKTDDKFVLLEKLLNEKLTTMQLIMDKNLAQHQAIASEMKAELSEIRGDVKALSAQVNTLQSKFGLYIALLGIGISVLLVLFQMFIK